ncbi:MAG TPA: hypothetical protein DCZ92_11495 [Elusimicrobia bacterium]|nr:hypothetical protein [Elusimicrobiota bacterium]
MKIKVLALAVIFVLGFLAIRARNRKDNSLTSYEPLPPIAAHRAARSTTNAETEPAAQPSAAAAGKEPAAPVAGKATGPRAAQPAAPALSPAADASARLAVLEEILQSKNDNDPRLDSAFNGLSPEAKKLFRQKYRQLPAEGRNERGTVVFLLGKNLKTAEDWAFMRAVLSEAPCLSLENCGRAAKAEPDSHSTSGVDLTLSYPAVMVLKRAERILQINRDAGGQDAAARQALELISAGKNSGAKVVADLAAGLEREFLSSPR